MGSSMRKPKIWPKSKVSQGLCEYSFIVIEIYQIYSHRWWEWHPSLCRVEIWKRTAGRVKYRIHWVVKGSSKYTDTCKQVGIMEVLSATLCYTYISSVNKVCNTNTATNRALAGEIKFTLFTSHIRDGVKIGWKFSFFILPFFPLSLVLV